MSRILQFRRPVQRACTVCMIPLPKLAPSWHSLCRQCYGHVRFRRAVEMFRAVRP